MSIVDKRMAELCALIQELKQENEELRGALRAAEAIQNNEHLDSLDAIREGL